MDDEIRIFPGSVLIKDSSDPAANGVYEGYVAQRWLNDVHLPEPFGFGPSYREALDDLLSELAQPSKNTRWIRVLKNARTLHR